MSSEFEHFPLPNPDDSDKQNRLSRLSPEARKLRNQAQTHILGLDIPTNNKVFLFETIDNLFLNMGTFKTDYSSLITLIDNSADKL